MLHILVYDNCCTQVSIEASNSQGHNSLITEKGFWHIIAFPLHLSSWNFTHRLLTSWGCALLILGSKGQSHNALITENSFWPIIAFPSPTNMKLYTDSPWVQDMPVWFRCKKLGEFELVAAGVFSCYNSPILVVITFNQVKILMLQQSKYFP